MTYDLGEEDGGRMFQAKERAFWGAGKRAVGFPVLREQREP